VYVERKIPVPEPYPVEVPVYVPVEVRVDRPYPVEVKVPVREPYPVEVPVAVSEPYPVEVPVAVDTPRSFPVHEKLIVDNLLSVPFPSLPFPAGRSFPHTPFPISEPYAYPAAVNTAWPGKFQGLPPFSFNQYGHHGEGLPILP
jgi:hypothetical protein